MVATRYIGITDVANRAQVEIFKMACSLYRKDRLPREQRPVFHAGVMMSYKTLHGFASKWSDTFPSKEVIRDVFSVPGVMNCLHYADYDAIDVTDSLVKAMDIAGPAMNALQLDMVWPEPEYLMSAMQRSGRKNKPETILQIGRNAMSKCGDNPDLVAEKLCQYGDSITHVRLDKSGGEGKEMDVSELLRYAAAIHERRPDLGKVFAGGLCAETAHTLNSIMSIYPASCDAQGTMRSSGDAHNPIEVERGFEYIKKVAQSVMKFPVPT